MVRKKHEDSYFSALFHLLCGHNALNLTITTVYLLAAVTYVLRSANGQPVRYLVAIYSTPHIDIECVSICGFVGISH